MVLLVVQLEALMVLIQYFQQLHQQVEEVEDQIMQVLFTMVNPVDQAIRAAYEDRLTLDENSLKMLGCSSPRCSELRYDTKKTKSECGESGQICPPSESILDRVLY